MSITQTSKLCTPTLIRLQHNPTLSHPILRSSVKLDTQALTVPKIAMISPARTSRSTVVLDWDTQVNIRLKRCAISRLAIGGDPAIASKRSHPGHLSNQTLLATRSTTLRMNERNLQNGGDGVLRDFDGCANKVGLREFIAKCEDSTDGATVTYGAIMVADYTVLQVGFRSISRLYIT